MTKIPTNLNEAGRKHITEELARLGIGFDIPATCYDIECLESFEVLVEGKGDKMVYEITNNQAAHYGLCNRGNGIFACIEILADTHVKFGGLYS